MIVFVVCMLGLATRLGQENCVHYGKYLLVGGSPGS